MHVYTLCPSSLFVLAVSKLPLEAKLCMCVSAYQFYTNNHISERSMSYTYLAITITDRAINALNEKAKRALIVIKRSFYNFQIPIKIWLKLFDSVLPPIALYASVLGST